MPNKFYLHRATSTVEGILPATNVEIHPVQNPTWTPGASNTVAATPLLTNRVMDAIISAVAQTSLAYTTDNVTTNQQQPLLRWVSAPLSAQTISSGQALTIRLSFSASSTVSAFQWTFWLGLWRPSSGTLVGTLKDGFGSVNSVSATASQVSALLSTTVATSQTAQLGDVLILTVWRNAVVQTMGTSYTNTLFYDGTTEASATNDAAYINFANNIALAPVYKNLTGSTAGRARTLAAFDEYEQAVISNAGLVSFWRMDDPASTNVIFSDAFTRANSDTLGGNWTEPSGSFEIFNNGARAYSFGTDVAVNTTPLGTANYKVTITGQAGAMWESGGRGMGIVARYVDINNFYLAWLDSTAPALKLYAVVGGTYNQIGSYEAATPPDPWTMSLGCNGSTISVEANGIERISVTDTSFSAEGDFGFRVFNAGTFTDHLFQSVSVSTYAAVGTQLNDYMGRNHGAYVGLTSKAASVLTSDAGTAVSFNGSDSYATIPDFPTPWYAGGFSIECWIRAASWVPSAVIISRREYNSNYGGFSLEVAASDGTLNFFVWNGSIWANVTTWRILATNQWHHIVATYEPTSGGTMWVSINGEVNVIQTSKGVFTPVAVGDTSIQVARNPWSGELFDGTIDELALYNPLIGTTATRDHYRKGVKARDQYGQLIESTSGLVAYWPMHEATTANVFDESGYGSSMRAGSGITFAVPGMENDDPSRAVSFDGTGNATLDSAFPYPVLDFGSGNFTFEGWIYPTTANIEPIIEYNDNTNAGLHIWQYDTSDKLYVNFIDTSLGNHSIQSGSGIIQQDTWHYIVVLRDGNTGRAYVDGVEVGTIDLTGVTVRTGINFNIGWRPGSAWAAGKFAQFAAYNVTLTTTQIDERWALLGEVAEPGQMPNVISAGVATVISLLTRLRSIIGTSAGISTATGVVSRKPQIRNLTGAAAGKTTIGTGGALYDQTILSDAPSAYWRLGEPSGTTAADASSNGRPATYVDNGGLVLGMTGPIAGDTAIRVIGFDGGYVQVADAAWLDTLFQGDFTIEFWGNFTVSGLVTKGGASTTTRAAYLRASTTTIQFGQYSSGSYQTVNATTPMSVGWNHIVVTKSGTTVTHYKNGVANGSGTIAGTAIDSTSAFIVGYNGSIDEGGGGFWDEVALYNTALSPARILAHYNATAGAPPGAVITAKRALIGFAPGIAVSTALILRKRAIVGVSAGVATEIGQLTARRRIVAVATGVSVASGQIGKAAQFKDLIGSATGVANVSVVITTKKALSGSVAGVAVSAGVIQRKRSLVVSSAGVASVTQVLTRKRALVASSAGVTSVSVALRAKKALTATSAGVASASGTIQRVVYKNLTAAAAGVATSAATVVRKRSVTGTSAGVSTEVGQPTAKRRIVAVSAGIATTIVALTRRRALTGVSAGVAVGVGQPARIRSIIASAAGVSTTSATVSKGTAYKAITGSAAGTSTATAIATRRRPVTGTSPGSSTAVGQITRRRSLVAVSAGTSTAVGTILRRRALVATSAGITTVTVNLAAKRRLTATSAGVALANGVVQKLGAVVFPAQRATGTAQELEATFRTGAVFGGAVMAATGQMIPLGVTLGTTFPAATATATLQKSIATIKSGVAFPAALASATVQAQIAQYKTGVIFSGALATATTQKLAGAIYIGTGFNANLATASAASYAALIRLGAGFQAQQMLFTASAHVSSMRSGTVWQGQLLAASAQSLSMAMFASAGMYADIAFVSGVHYPIGVITGANFVARVMSANSLLWVAVIKESFGITSPGPDIIWSEHIVPVIVRADELVPYIVSSEEPVPVIVNGELLIPYLYRKDELVPIIVKSDEV